MIYLEGTDGVGKTATAEGLKKYGIECMDRNKEIISKNMLFDVSLNKRVKIYNDYLRKTHDIIIFLINNNEKEMLRRVLSRDNVDEYDLETNRYNQLYKETYLYMEKNNLLEGKLFMVDCTSLDLNKQVQKVKKLIQSILK